MAYKKALAFQFSMPTKIVYGAGAVKNAAIELQTRGIGKAILITDSGLARLPIVEKVKGALGNMIAAVYDRVEPDSGISIVNEAAKLARESGAKGVVSVGGGSSIDTAKCVAVLIAKGGEDIRNWMGIFKVQGPTAPHIVIPTTAGTGSEVTSMAVIKDHEKNVKGVVVDLNIIPQVGILDPEMTVSLPPAVTAATGMDALSHAIEAMHSTNYNPLSDSLALWAIEAIAEYLPVCVENGADIESRGMQLLASNAAGAAFQNALVGVVHAMAHSAGGLYGIPHGVAISIFLPHGMRYNMKKRSRRYALVARAFGVDVRNMSDEDAGNAAIGAVESLSKKIGMPQRLRDVGVPEDGIPKIAALSMADMTIFTNPVRPLAPADIIPVIQAAW